MRTATAGELALLSQAIVNECYRVWVKDSDGTYKDLTNLNGFDWVISVDVPETIDQPVSGANITLWRNTYYWSLATLMTVSGCNQNAAGAYAPLIDLNREIKIETATVASGTAPAAGDWKNVFQGRIDAIDEGGSDAKITLSCRDMGGILLDQFIEYENSYGADDGSQTAEQVIQAILDDNHTGVTLYTPTPSNWAVKQFAQQKEPVLTAINNIAMQRGWMVRYKWDSGTETWRLTFYEPDRVKTVSDYTFSPSNYFDCKKLDLNISRIRTVVRTVYPDSAADGAPRLLEYPDNGGVQSATNNTITQKYFDSGTATDADGSSLTDSSKSWKINTHKEKYVYITAGTGAGQFGLIKENTDKQLIISGDWTAGAGCSYVIVKSVWTVNEHQNKLVRITSGTGKSQERTITSNTATALTVSQNWTTNPDNTSEFAITEATDSARPIEIYGRRFMEVTTASTGQIDTKEEAYRLARMVYLDVSRPGAEMEIECRSFWPAELGDLYTFQADNIHYDTDQQYGVVGIRRSLTPNEKRTSLTLRGKPAGAYENWFIREARPGIAPALSIPRVPSGIIVTPGLDDSTEIVRPFILVEWNPNPETIISYYQLRMMKALDGGGWGEPSYYQTTGSQYKIPNLIEGKQYKIQVQAINRKGNFSDWSQEQIVTALTDTTPPGDIIGLTDYFEGETLMLTWQAVSDYRPIVYEVRKGNTWADGQMIGRTPLNKFATIGDGTYWVAAVYRTIYSTNPANVAIEGLSLISNVVASYDEKATQWSGAKPTGMYVVDNNLQLGGVFDIDSLGGQGNIDSIAGTWDCMGGVPPKVYYTIPSSHVIDVGTAASCFANVVTTLDAPTGTSAKVQINTAGNDSVYTGWQDFVNGQKYVAKLFNFRLALEASDPGQTPICSGLDIIVDVPDVFDKGYNISVAETGATITFNRTFHSPPAVLVTILSAIAGDDAVVSNITNTGFDIQIKNADVGVARSINWISQGY